MIVQEIGVILFVFGLYGFMAFGMYVFADAVAHMGYGRIELETESVQ